MPEAQVEALRAMYTAENENVLLGGQPTFVIDAIDNVDTKIALLAGCQRRGIPVVCVAGAGTPLWPLLVSICSQASGARQACASGVVKACAFLKLPTGWTKWC